MNDELVYKRIYPGSNRSSELLESDCNDN